MSAAATPGPAAFAVRSLADISLRYGAIAVAFTGPAAVLLDALEEPARAALAHVCDEAAQLNDALARAVEGLPDGQAWPA